MESKPWYTSKTLWFNLICALLATGEATFNILQPVLPVNVYAVFSFILPVGNAMLRVITTTKLGA